MNACPKTLIVRDRKWLDAQHEMACLFTGQHGGDHGSVVPCHVGTLGRGLKSPDDETLPLLWIFNATRNPVGFIPEWRSEVEMLRLCPPDDVVLRAYRALGREIYREWKR